MPGSNQSIRNILWGYIKNAEELFLYEVWRHQHYNLCNEKTIEQEINKNTLKEKYMLSLHEKSTLKRLQRTTGFEGRD